MSFILDALKKAEAERSRNLGPVLMDVRIAPARQRLPTWAWLLGCVLLANMLVLAWLLLRRPAVPAAAAVATTSAAPEVAPVATPPPPTYVIPPAQLPPAGLPVVVQPDISPAAAAPLDTDKLPTMQDLLASGIALPPLQLSLHVYDDVPGNRYVLLNAKRLREGDELPDGVKVERITPRGVVLDMRGRRFLLVAGS